MAHLFVKVLSLRSKFAFICSIALLLCLQTKAQHDFKAGLRIIKLYDSSRIYKPNTIPNDSLHFRPIEVDLWYPALLDNNGPAVTFQDLVELLESRAKRFDDTGDYRGISEELLKYICSGLDCSDYTALKRIRTESHLNARRAIGSFPLILYFSAMNGMSYENYILFESLAKKGFVVASISSIGTYPGNMTMQLKDLLQQTADAKFVREYLTKQDLYSGKVGLVGYSLGGLSATLLALGHPQSVDALVSLNGSEAFRYYGNAEDKSLQLIRNSDSFSPEKLTVPYLYLDSDYDTAPQKPDSVYNIHKYLTSHNTYLQLKKSMHEDFSCIYTFSNDEKKAIHGQVQDLVLAYLSDKLKNENKFDEATSRSDVSFQFPVIKKSSERQILLQGTVRDYKTKSPLPYVNIGILNHDKGTATDANGHFRLSVLPEHEHDTLKISIVGYEPSRMPLKDVFDGSSQPLSIFLREKVNELNEVVVLSRTKVTRRLGNTTQSKFFGGKFASDDLGAEMAIKINIGKRPVYLDKFSFNVSYNDGDSAVLRLNVYSIKNGLPYENHLKDNIIVSVGNKTGKIEVDLRKYSILLTDDFFVSLEFIAGNKTWGIVFSASFANNATYYRKASQGRWKKYPMGVGFNVTVSY